MNDATLYGLITAALLLVVAFFAFALCRAAGRASRAEEQHTPVDSYQGPDSLHLLEDLEAHITEYGNTISDFYDTTTGDRDA